MKTKIDFFHFASAGYPIGLELMNIDVIHSDLGARSSLRG